MTGGGSRKSESKGLALGGLAMTAATWLVKNQFGGPVGLAQFVASKIRKKNIGSDPWFLSVT